MMRSLARIAFHRAGGLRLARYRNRAGFRILMYHRFPRGCEPALTRQCAHLRKHYHVLSMTEVARILSAREAFPPNSLAVTVDDGYRDFLTGCRTFAAFRIPVTLYLTTGFVDRKLWFWVDQLHYLFEQAPSRRLSIPLSTGRTLEYPADSGYAVKEAFKELPNDERLRWMEALPGLLGVPMPVHPPEENAPLTWEEIRRLSAEGVDLGAHTGTHPILSRVREDGDLRQEIDGSKERIEEQTGRSVLHFCYPNGKWRDFDARVVEMVRHARFETAVTTEPGLNFRGADPLRLLRIGVTPDYPQPYFESCAAAFRV